MKSLITDNSNGNHHVAIYYETKYIKNFLEMVCVCARAESLLCYTD